MNREHAIDFASFPGKHKHSENIPWRGLPSLILTRKNNGKYRDKIESRWHFRRI
jgi:hypothetical protein